eukprot:2079299-Rhodomonas_salina.1
MTNISTNVAVALGAADDLPCMNMEVAGGKGPCFPRKKVTEDISTRSRSAIFVSKKRCDVVTLEGSRQ